ncbi:MAG TPA: DUF1003 domain-containing protein [Actinocrinis sp.]|uniref:DUF1003 domain-containing protein n=1 Tax=Actinocrinis sp. TaxID=1920516 RepID=UPI002DDD7C6D|nr:DUF1003 domain-containing protein [Actinocrinis sp.]HEV2346452.1 DUF1003 domain-containing protein [Actinocrinis sp.]
MSLWHHHPHVRTGGDLTLGERAADKMRNSMGSWTFIFVFVTVMICWAGTNTLLMQRVLHHQAFDPYPYILLNLLLSTLAGLQGGILLIASKRADQISSELAQHDYQVNTDSLRYHVVQAQVLVMLADAASGVTLSDEQRKALLAPPTIPLPPRTAQDDEWPAVR